MTTTFGFMHIRSQIDQPTKSFQATISAFTTAFESLGGVQWDESQLSENQPLLFFVDTGGSEEILLKLQAQRNNFHPREQVLLIAHPGYNSLPTALEVLARFQQDQVHGRVLFLKGPDDQIGLQQIRALLDHSGVQGRLNQTRIGLIGDPSDWLVASSPGGSVLQETWGPELVPIDMDELVQILKTLDIDPENPVLENLTQGARAIQEPSKKELADVVRVYLALKQVIQDHQLTALSVRCFDLVLGLNTTGCFALSQLIDEGVIAGCEGDLVSTMAMVWARELLGETPWMANPAHLDETSNTLTLAHCTVPRTMITEYGLRSHLESGLGVGIQGTFAMGPVTVLRLGGKMMEKLWLGEGVIVKTGKSEDLCRTQVDIKLSRGSVSDLLTKPLGNHIVMVRGHHAQTLQNWWSAMISNRGSYRESD